MSLLSKTAKRPGWCSFGTFFNISELCFGEPRNLILPRPVSSLTNFALRFVRRPHLREQTSLTVDRLSLGHVLKELCCFETHYHVRKFLATRQLQFLLHKIWDVNIWSCLWQGLCQGSWRERSFGSLWKLASSLRGPLQLITCTCWLLSSILGCLKVPCFSCVASITNRSQVLTKSSSWIRNFSLV